jgi:hypothetical protein
MIRIAAMGNRSVWAAGLALAMLVQPGISSAHSLAFKSARDSVVGVGGTGMLGVGGTGIRASNKSLGVGGTGIRAAITGVGGTGMRGVGGTGIRGARQR